MYNDCGTIRESVIDDIVVEKFNDITTKIAILCKQLSELDDLADKYMEIEQSKVSASDDIIPVINDDERDLLLSGIDFLNEYKKLYDYLPDTPNVFTSEEKKEIENRFAELDNKMLEEYARE